MCDRGRPSEPSAPPRGTVCHEAPPRRPHRPDAGSQPDRRDARGAATRSRAGAMCRNHDDGTDNGRGSRRHRGQLVGGRSRVAKACLNARYARPVGTRVVAESPPAHSKVAEYSTVTLGGTRRASPWVLRDTAACLTRSSTSQGLPNCMTCSIPFAPISTPMSTWPTNGAPTRCSTSDVGLAPSPAFSLGAGTEVTAVDPAAASIGMARRKPWADRVRWLVGDATSLPARCRWIWSP